MAIRDTSFLQPLQTQHTTAAHSAGLVAMDAKADLVATAGCGTRQGRVVAETHVKVGGRGTKPAHTPLPARMSVRTMGSQLLIILKVSELRLPARLLCTPGV